MSARVVPSSDFTRGQATVLVVDVRAHLWPGYTAAAPPTARILFARDTTAAKAGFAANQESLKVIVILDPSRTDFHHPSGNQQHTRDFVGYVTGVGYRGIVLVITPGCALDSLSSKLAAGAAAPGGPIEGES